ncbi:hypothetical protein [Candidatus Fukatsuia endosymbiont of Tuberolachnus salignus]|uniref:hypothetical protein n=1 Tax=Candidatus Fukatsuia endosymbiont of Tuberolachnus salignus TaxID=3077957 RepID=UPI00313C655C
MTMRVMPVGASGSELIVEPCKTEKKQPPSNRFIDILKELFEWLKSIFTKFISESDIQDTLLKAQKYSATPSDKKNQSELITQLTALINKLPYDFKEHVEYTIDKINNIIIITYDTYSTTISINGVIDNGVIDNVLRQVNDELRKLNLVLELSDLRVTQEFENCPPSADSQTTPIVVPQTLSTLQECPNVVMENSSPTDSVATKIEQIKQNTNEVLEEIIAFLNMNPPLEQNDKKLRTTRSERIIGSLMTYSSALVENIEELSNVCSKEIPPQDSPNLWYLDISNIKILDSIKELSTLSSIHKRYESDNGTNPDFMSDFHTKINEIVSNNSLTVDISNFQNELNRIFEKVQNILSVLSTQKEA